MSKPLQGTCDSCNQVTKIDFKMLQHPRGIQETYFKCEHCDTKYTCFVTDEKARKLQKKKSRLVGYRYTNNRIRLQDEISQRMTKLKRELLK